MTNLKTRLAKIEDELLEMAHELPDAEARTVRTAEEEAALMAAFDKATMQWAETALGQPIAYGGECILNQDCPCSACRQIYGPHKSHIGNHDVR